MRHGISGKHLSRTKNERTALLRNLERSLILHGSIKTTRAKAVFIQASIEKLITKAKKGTDAAKKDLISELADRKLAASLLDMASTRFMPRQSGYTRIVKLGSRRGDNAELVHISFVDELVAQETVSPDKKKIVHKKTTQKETEQKKTGRRTVKK